MVRPIPEGFTTLTAHITVKGAAEAIAFYEKAFGAELAHKMEMGGSIGHAELRIGSSVLMLNDEFPTMGAFGPPEQGSGVRLHLYVEDTDKAFEQAVQAGCEVAMPPTDMFWGDRYAMVKDPFGHGWAIATHVEDVSPEECEARAKQAMPG